MTKIYDYYIEPCQLCISRNGSTYDICGWCNDSDTHYKKSDGSFPGDWISIPHGGYGYPFHELPHPNREYFKDNKLVESSLGKLPTDVLMPEVEQALSRNKTIQRIHENSHSTSVDNILNTFLPSNNETILSSKIDEFTEKYYSPYVNTLSLNSHSKLPTGRFDQYTLGVTISGLDQEFVKESQLAFETLKREVGSDLSLDVDVNQLLKSYPELKNIIIVLELLSHENFHLYQTLVLKTPYKLYESSMQIANLRAMILFSMIREEVKVDIDKHNSIFFNIESFENEEAKDTLESLFLLYKSNADVIENFFSYKECDLEFDVVDIFEGAAFCFQKIINRTSSVETFSVPDNSYYMRSKKYFNFKGGSNDILYLLFCHLSLKYGLLDDGGFMDVMPTPQKVFHYLCNFIEEIELLFDNTRFSNKPYFGSSTSEILRRLDVELNSDESEFFDSLKVNSEQIQLISTISKAIQLCQKKVEELFMITKVKFSDPVSCINDARGLAIKEKIVSDYPAFESDKFLVALITIPAFGQKFICSELPNYMSVTYQGLMGMELTLEEENTIYSIVNEIDQLYRGPVYCCPEHEEATLSVLSQCRHEFSLNMRVQSLFGLSLNDIVD